MNPVTHHQPPFPRSNPPADSDGPAVVASPFTPAVPETPDSDLAYPPAGAPGTRRDLGRPHAAASLVERAAEVVAGWIADRPQSALPPETREQLLSTLPQVLVDGRERAAYLGHLRAARAAPGRAAAVDAVAERVTLPTDQILRDGLAGVSDQALGVLAADPSALRSLSALIDESADAGEVGAAWWAAIHRAGRQALAERPFPPPTVGIPAAGRTA